MSSRASSWFSSMIGLKCPRCRTGNLFQKSTFAFSKPFEMHEECPKCKLNYWPEPGFYYGAMFLSYIVFSFPCLGFVFFLRWVLGYSIGASMLLLCLVAGLGFVYVFRVSRSLWLAMNVKYDQSIADNLKND